MKNKLFSIGHAAIRSRLTTHAIRAWERRYGAVSPVRTSKNRRMYSEDDLQRLILLKEATDARYSISDIARLSRQELRDLIEARVAVPDAGSASVSPASSEEHVASCLDAVKTLDSAVLESGLNRALVDLGLARFLESMVTPLMVRIGEEWGAGRLRIFEEHFASATVRGFLGTLLARAERSRDAPCAIVATPAGQMHEMGALVVAIHAGSIGWVAHYLGPNLPAEEIAAAVRRKNARAVVLSILYRNEESKLAQELERLRAALEPEIRILAGGPGAAAVQALLPDLPVVPVGGLPDLRAELEGPPGVLP